MDVLREAPSELAVNVFVYVSVVQWMATGQSGPSGRSALAAAVRATGPECAPAATLQLSTEAGHVRAAPWRSSCAASGLVQVGGANIRRI